MPPGSPGSPLLVLPWVGTILDESGPTLGGSLLKLSRPWRAMDSGPVRRLVLSWRRLGLIGGRGGAARLLLRERLPSASDGRATAGTRDVDVNSVGSEMSWGWTLRFIDSGGLTMCPVEWS